MGASGALAIEAAHAPIPAFPQRGKEKEPLDQYGGATTMYWPACGTYQVAPHCW